jgi:hypothetical protein
MKRLFYLAVGAGAGIVAVRKATRAAQKLTPSGLAGSAGGAVSGMTGAVRTFLDDVRFNMAAREIELTDALTGESDEAGESASRLPGERNGRSAS